MRYYIASILFSYTVCAVAASLHAADINFGSPLVAGNASSDFLLSGTLDRAYDFGTNQKLIINGIEFDPFNTKLFGDTTNLDGPYDAYTTDGQTGDYATFLSHGDGHDNDARVIQFNNLAPGVLYTVEVVASGLRARSDCCSAGAGYTNLRIAGDSPAGTGALQWDANDATSRHIYGTFLSDASGSQTLNLNLFGTTNIPGQTNSIQIHGIVLSYAAVPEPTALVLFAAGTIGLAISRRR
jgi:PEP-CTERM motif-containing protein